MQAPALSQVESPDVARTQTVSARPLRVLLISHTCQSPLEGQPKAQLLGAMKDIELRVLLPDRWRHYGKWRGASVIANPTFQASIGKVRFPWVGPAQFYLHYYPDLARILTDFKPDVIDLWEEPWSLVSAHTVRLRNRLLPSAKLISETEQNIDKHLPFPFENFRSYSLRQADFAVGRNAESIEIIRRKGFTGPSQVVPNAVDAELFCPMDRNTCRAAIGAQDFVAGYVGRLVEEKGLMDAIDALPLCQRQVNLLFVGDGDFKPALEQRAQALGLTSRVRFLPGRPLSELPPLMNAIDVLLLPSRTTPRWKEQFGRVIIEAHACGTPVIGSNSGAIPEVIENGGLVFPEKDPKALANAINLLASSPEKCRSMGLAGRAQVEQKYTWQRVAEQMADIYRNVVR